MAAAKTAIKESLLGTERNPELSTQTKSTFDRNARQDESSDEAYMTENDFINAIAPEGESYVRNSNSFVYDPLLDRQFAGLDRGLTSFFFHTAQDKTRAICNTLPNR